MDDYVLAESWRLIAERYDYVIKEEEWKMIDFSFTEEQELFRKSLEKFAQEVLTPLYAEGDRLGKFPAEQIK